MHSVLSNLIHFRKIKTTLTCFIHNFFNTGSMMGKHQLRFTRKICKYIGQLKNNKNKVYVEDKICRGLVLGL